MSLVVGIRISYALQAEHALCHKRNGFPRRFAPRNDRGVLYNAFSFPKWHFIKSGDPSVGLTAASSPKGGAKRAHHSHVASVSNLCREALPLLGEVAHSAEGVASL